MLIKKDQSDRQVDLLRFSTTDGAAYEVPVEGSIGLLALGHIGLIAWRKKREAAATKASGRPPTGNTNETDKA